MSPLGILLAGVGTAAGILVGLPVVAAAGHRRRSPGVVGCSPPCLGVRRRRGSPRRASASRGAPTACRPRRPSAASTTSSSRWQPVRCAQRLELMSGRLDDGVDESWRIARRGHEIGDGDREDRHGVGRGRARRPPAPARQRRCPSPAQAQTIEALEAQLASAHRLTALAERSRDRLRLLDARFDELLARTVEVSVGVGRHRRARSGRRWSRQRARGAPHRDGRGRAGGRRPTGASPAGPRDRVSSLLRSNLSSRPGPRCRASAGCAHHRVRLRDRPDRARRRLPDRQRDPEHRLRAAPRRRALGDARPAVHLVRRARRRGVDERRGHGEPRPARRDHRRRGHRRAADLRPLHARPGGDVDAEQFREVGTLLTRIFLLQIFFYGATGVANALLNSPPPVLRRGVEPDPAQPDHHRLAALPPRTPAAGSGRSATCSTTPACAGRSGSAPPPASRRWRSC